ncbi:MAG TPA: transporter substrate-binding domain-containing protein [Pseudomonadales bacterium]|nr:transporter substrate-binding domain-containing protein [Pseudomonadales bacterium]
MPFWFRVTGKSLLAPALLALGGLPGNSNACENGTAIISGGTTNPPLTWRSQNKLVGADVEFMQTVLAEVGIKAIADEGGPWKRVLRRAELGQVDIVMGFRKSANSEKVLNFLDPPITPAVQSVFYHVNRSFDYSSWSDLIGRSGSMTLGSNFDTEFEDYLKSNLTVQYVPKIEQNFSKLDKGRVDYMLGPLMSTKLYIQKYGYSDRIVAASKPLMTIQEHIAIAKNSSCGKYADHIEKRISEYIMTDKFNDLIENYFVKWIQEEPQNK